MNRRLARFRTKVAICVLLSLLFSQWVAAAHLCATEQEAGGHAGLEVAGAQGCHHEHEGSDQGPDDANADLTCALHCAQPDEASAPAKIPGLDGSLAGHVWIPALAADTGILPVLSTFDPESSRDARRRLIERGALLI